VREIEALEPMSFALLTERRSVPPPGAAGGENGACGRNQLIPAGGSPVLLAAKAEGTLQAGDRLRLETPGGGGYGPPSADDMSITR